MCGIAGICNFNNKTIDAGLIKKMIRVLEHRGPDDEGIYLSKLQNPDSQLQVGLGHKRLSIIDLEGGHQPMANEDGTIWIVYNGEVYNFLELKEQLLKKGHRFKTRSDTEVIIHLYEEEGCDCVKHLRGMFAFCIWDVNKQRLFLARDRIGQKPLNFLCKNGSLLFASEIKAILESDMVKRELDFESLDYYLSFGYSPRSNTMFKGIKKLPPAHFLTYGKNGLKIERYWRLSYKDKIKMKEPEYEERILDILKESVGLRLISDVPLGVFLSGGTDSSTVTALMAECSSAPIKTFSIGFDEKDYNELRYAKMVASRYQTDHHELIVRADALELLPKLAWFYNEPFGDSSCIPTYYVANVTKKFVTVALNGDGGDESFGGYERYIAAKLTRITDSLPVGLIKFNLQFIRQLEKFNLSNAKKRFLKYGANFLESIIKYQDLYKRYARWLSFFTNEQKKSLYSERLKSQLNDIDSVDGFLQICREVEAQDLVDKVMGTDIMSYLPGDLLVKVDIATMANSLEGRSPFLDHKLIEFAASIPPNKKLKNFRLKYLLKKTVAKKLPPQILYRRKMGFGVPIGEWFCNKWKAYAYEMLLDKKSLKRGYFNKEYIENLLEEHTSKIKDNTHRIWALLNFELWHRIFIDKEKL